MSPSRLVCTAARYVREEDGVVTMIDLEEIDLSAAPSTTSARRIRAGKKFAAKIFANGNARSNPSWKRSLAALRGRKTRLRLAPRFEPI
jgi:hypothetical protein